MLSKKCWTAWEWFHVSCLSRSGQISTAETAPWNFSQFLLIYNHQFSSNFCTIFSSAFSDSETDRKQCRAWTLGWAAWGNDVTMTTNSEIGVVGSSILFQRMIPRAQCKYLAECVSPSSVLHWMLRFLTCPCRRRSR